MNVKNLEDEVIEALLRIRNMPEFNNNYRCHEIARLLKEDLEKKGYEPILRDGWAEYDFVFITNWYLDRMKDQDLAAILRTEVQESKKTSLSTVHSWLEVEDFVVDYHNPIEFEGNNFGPILIVKEAKDLEGKAEYIPYAGRLKLFGNEFLIFYFTKIPVKVRL